MKYLVTGASGFIGRHLCRYLCEQGHEVVAGTRHLECECPPGISKLSGTVMDPATASCWVEKVEPDAIVHLAAQSLPRVSWEDPTGTFEVNVNGTMNLLTAMKEHGSKARFIMVSSSSVYAPSPDGSPIAEDGATGGASPYALSKLAAEQAALLYGGHYGIDVVSIRPFFVIGPAKVGDVSSDFAQRIVAIERGESDAMKVGSLEVTRDFLDIQDAVRAFELIVDKAPSGEVFNVCSGRGTTIRTLLDTLKSLSSAGISEVEDPSLIRPIEEPIKVGDPRKLEALGWSPEVAFEDSMKSILEHWRQQA